jgi:SAM-dependent methyltransferase/uncharacterized protein (DUF2062 family)
MSVEAARPVTAAPSLWREELRRAWHELRGTGGSPERAAAAVALGTFIGCQPIFGLHTPLVLFGCLFLRLDAALAWVASNVSNPLLAPFLVTLEVQIGARIRTGRWLAFDLEAARATGLDGVIGHAFVGAPVVGAVLALGIGAGAWGAATLATRLGVGARPPYRLPPHAPAWWRAADAVARRYAAERGASAAARTRFHYVRLKLLGDPVMRMISELEGGRANALGDVLDLGTGRGQLGLVLLELGVARSVNGCDWDGAKIAAARLAAAEPPALAARFDVADLRVAELAPADTVLLVDVLHYFSDDEQDALLERAARAVRPGGRLVVREAEPARGWRSWVTLAEERFFTAVRFNRGARVRLRPVQELRERLEAAGFLCRVAPAHRGTPFSNVLLVAERARAEP